MGALIGAGIVFAVPNPGTGAHPLDIAGADTARRLDIAMGLLAVVVILEATRRYFGTLSGDAKAASITCAPAPGLVDSVDRICR